MPKKPIVVERTLERHKAVGRMDYENNTIEIDPRQDSKDYLDTLIHEKLHHLDSKWSEEKVIKWANALSQFLWEQNYRKVKL